MIWGRTTLQLGHQEAVQKVIRGRELERTRRLESSVVDRMLFKMMVSPLFPIIDMGYAYGSKTRLFSERREIFVENRSRCDLEAQHHEYLETLIDDFSILPLSLSNLNSVQKTRVPR